MTDRPRGPYPANGGAERHGRRTAKGRDDEQRRVPHGSSGRHEQRATHTNQGRAEPPARDDNRDTRHTTHTTQGRGDDGTRADSTEDGARNVRADSGGAGRGRPRPRRSPAPEERQLDAERSRRRLLAAALDEFAAKGFAGARVHEIAARAGLNKQLINYYFGGKEGLYRELQHEWLRREEVFADHDLPLAELAPIYLHEALADPRGVRLEAWRGLADPERTPDIDDREDLDRLADRQARGEIADDLDAPCVLLAVMAMVTLPAAMPQLARKVGLDPHDPAFETRYGETLRRIITRLGTPRPAGEGGGS